MFLIVRIRDPTAPWSMLSTAEATMPETNTTRACRMQHCRHRISPQISPSSTSCPPLSKRCEVRQARPFAPNTGSVLITAASESSRNHSGCLDNGHLCTHAMRLQSQCAGRNLQLEREVVLPPWVHTHKCRSIFLQETTHHQLEAVHLRLSKKLRQSGDQERFKQKA